MTDTTGPLAVPQGQHWPAASVSPEASEHAQRQAAAWELAREQQEAATAARERAVSERIAQRRAGHGEPGQVATAVPLSRPERAAVDHDGEHGPVAG